MLSTLWCLHLSFRMLLSSFLFIILLYLLLSWILDFRITFFSGSCSSTIACSSSHYLSSIILDRVFLLPHCHTLWYKRSQLLVMSGFLDPGSPTGPLNNNVSTLDDIPLDTAPVTLSPFTGEHFNLWKKRSVSFDHEIYSILLKGTNSTILMQTLEYAATGSVAINKPWIYLFKPWIALLYVRSWEQLLRIRCRVISSYTMTNALSVQSIVFRSVSLILNLSQSKGYDSFCQNSVI